MAPPTLAKAIAVSLRDLGVETIFGVVGIPVVDIAEEAIDLGIRFIGFRNEQSCSYAASAYGFITGKPGVCLLVGGPGVLHGLAGIGNCSANAFPALFLAGSSETTLTGKGAFQELDAVSFLTPHTKIAIRPSLHEAYEPQAVAEAIRKAFYSSGAGRPGPTFVDLPADLIMKEMKYLPRKLIAASIQSPKAHPDPKLVHEAANLIRAATSPLVIIGKGCAYARAEETIRQLISSTSIPFLPTPMGKGVVPDDSPLNSSSARSTALREADVVLVLGARLNWILHFGSAPKFRSDVRFIQVDISAEELNGKNSAGKSSLGVVSDIGAFVVRLHDELQGWSLQPPQTSSPHPFPSKISHAAAQNEAKVSQKSSLQTPAGSPLTYERTFYLIKETLHSLSPPEDGGIVYISEGANTMDISRSIFPLHHPRQRLDAGTHATMGLGLGYAIAAYTAYNLDSGTEAPRKKVVALEGDSALGFSAMEIETMQRYKMPILIFVMNNSGVYHGDSVSGADWKDLQKQTLAVDTPRESSGQSRGGLRSTTLGYETHYEKLAEMVGGKGFFVRTEDELVKATTEGFLDDEHVCVVNVVIEPGIGKKIGFAWQQQVQAPKASKL